MKFINKAYAKPATAEDNPDAYLCIDLAPNERKQKNLVLRVGYKRDISDLQDIADALNEWAGKSAEV